MTKFLGLSVVAGMLSGIFSQMGEECNSFSEGMNRAVQSLMMLSMMSMVAPGGGFMRMAAPGRLFHRGESMSRVQKGTSQKLTKAGGLRGLGGGLLKGLSIFGRFLPVLGQVVFGFQIVSGVLKAFTGFDLTKKLGDMTKGLGTALGFIKTPAEKTAEAFDNVAEAAAKGLAYGAFGQTSGEFVKTLGSLLPEAVFE